MGYPCIVGFSPVIIKYDHFSSCCFKERLTGYLCFRLPLDQVFYGISEDILY